MPEFFTLSVLLNVPVKMVMGGGDSCHFNVTSRLKPMDGLTFIVFP